jgi:sigma-B regulation protein RsbU (phosphoserine phosphatase)
MTKIATSLRLRKMAGADDRSATLSEANAALRDLNRRFIQEREEARDIQQSLLPRKLPKDPRFELAVSYEPLEEVGGDWYNVSQTEGGRLSLLIADVTGHGLSAALIGSMTKLAISCANTELPHELLGAVNRVLSPQMPEGRFVTVGSFLFDPENGQLQYARGGHPPAMLLARKEKVVHQLKGNGFAVGFMEDGEYSAEKAVLQPGDALLLVTDGLLEAENRARENYGLERLQEVLLATKPEDTAVEILEQVLESFETFRDGRILKDDVTLVLLKRSLQKAAA